MSIKSNRLFIGLSLIPALVAVVGCESTQKNDDRSAGRGRDDKHITADAKKALDQDSIYKFSGVNVSTFAGTVQLGGFANTEDQKRRASEVVRRVPGVQNVMNGISLKPAATSMTGRDRETSKTYAEPDAHSENAQVKSESLPEQK